MRESPEPIVEEAAGGDFGASATLCGGMARQHARAGLAVFPVHSVIGGRCTCGRADCASPGKHPLTARGFHDATTDDEQVALWWTRWPDANVGIATGAVSRLVVLDVDPRHGGDESLAALCDEFAPLPPTHTIRTGGGGVHYYFRHPGVDVPSRNGHVGAGLDIKANRGYVVAPPSVHASGAAYECIEEREPAHLPPWLLARVLAPRPRAPAADRAWGGRDGVRGSRAVEPGGGTPYGLAALEHECEAVAMAPEGKRRDTLNTAALKLGQLVAGGELADELARARLAAAAQTAGLPDDEIRRTVQIGIDDGRRAPRTAPPRNGFSRRTDRDFGQSTSRTTRTSDADELVEPPTPRPRIVVRNELSALTSEAEAALVADPDSGLYHRAGMLVRVVRADHEAPRGLRRPAGAPIIEVATGAHVRERLDLAAAFVSLRKRSGEWLESPALPPKWLVDTLLARGSWPLPRLGAVFDAPTMREDGTILDTSGHDAETGILYEPSSSYPPVPLAPSADDLRLAVAALRGPWSDFPFVGTCDLAAAIAALVTPVARLAIDGPTPMFAFRATAPGTGKSLGVDVCSIVATGRCAARMSIGPNDDDTRKLILSIGLEGAAVVLLDNAEGVLGSPVLAAALTSTTYKDRLLGATKVVTVSLRGTTWYTTGNGLSFKGDLGRRIVPIDLDAGTEHPEDREGFRHPDLLAYVRSHRPQLAAAALTVLRAFHVAGRPSHGMPRMGSFEGWDRLVRGALCWADIGDPIAGRQRIREEGDLDLDSLRGALLAWNEAFGSQPVTLPDVVARAGQHAAGLHDALLALVTRPGRSAALDARTLGYALRQRRGRIASGLRFENAGKAKGYVRWRVAQVGSDGAMGSDLPHSSDARLGEENHS